MICSASDCTRKSKARGYCDTHRKVQRRGENPDTYTIRTRGWFRGTQKEILDHYTEKSEDGCWVWTGPSASGKRVNAYGLIVSNGVREMAHRVSYKLNVGEIPANMFVCHHCDTPKCVRPDHLFLGTPQDNVIDMMSKGRHLKGEKHGQAKLSSADVSCIQDKAKAGETQRALAKKYGVSQPHISKITRNLTQHLVSAT